MKRIRLAVLLMAVGTVLFSNSMCSKKETPTGASSSSYINVICPLKVGNYWVYADSSFDSTGAVMYDDSSKVGLGGSVTIHANGKDYLAYLWSWYWDVTDTLSPSQSGFPMINMSDGIHNIGLDDTVFVNELWVKYPCVIGNSWTSIYSIYYHPYDSSYSLYADSSTYECISTNQQFICGLGSIRSYVYHSQYSYKSILKNKNNNSWGFFGALNNTMQYDIKSTIDFDIYFAPNIGYLGYLIKENGVVLAKKSLKRYYKN